MKNILTTILVSLLLASCGDKQELPAGLKAEAFKLPEDKQQQMINALRNSNIVFMIDDRGFINHMAYDISEVRKLKRNIIYGSDINNYDALNVSFLNPERKNAFIRVLETKNIWYNVSNFEGTINVHYFRSAVDIVDAAYQKSYFDYFENQSN